MHQNVSEEYLTKHDEWDNPKEAEDCLFRFCIMLNFHFQGLHCEIELPGKW
ncbi:MAG: hypothetical protein ACOCXD_00625 [Bacteroidota bacterium]